MSSTLAGATALYGMALYAGHHVGDYWVQTDHQARTKGCAGGEGRRACLMHVATYTLTQAGCLGLAAMATGARWSLQGFLLGLLISAVTHYLADRREYGIMFRLARMLPGKAGLLKLGVPRGLVVEAGDGIGHRTRVVKLDNPSLGTGGWALDQSWHVFWGVFVAALVIGGLS